jgi:hypothetical protein
MKWIKLWTSIITSTLVQEAGISGVGSWALILILAGNDKTPGKFRFKDVDHLARIMNSDSKILSQHLKIFENAQRIKIKNLNGEFSLSVLKWHKYQQDMYGKVDGHNPSKNRKVDTQSPPGGEERRGQERRIKGKEEREEREIKEGETSISKQHFFSLLKSFPSYPFQEKEDSDLFEFFSKKYPKVDIVIQTKKKIEWWLENPQAAHSSKKNQREQLIEWLLGEAEYQNQGPI